MTGAVPKNFLDTIVVHRDDDTPRLVYADWLEETGQHERADFIRTQVESARLPEWDAAQVRLRLHLQALLARHGENWMSELPKIAGGRWEGFRRGLVAEVYFQDYEAMRANAHAFRALTPLEAVTVHWPDRRTPEGEAKPIAELREMRLLGRPYGEEVDQLAASPQLSTLDTLTVMGLDADDLTRLVASPHLRGLQTLRIPSNGLGNAGLRALIQSPTLQGLHRLELSGPGYHESYYDDPLVTASGIESLARWLGLARIRSLELAGGNIGRDGLRTLLRSPHLGELRHLSLRGSRLDGQAMAEFESAASNLRLESLDIGQNVIKDVGAEYLAISPCLQELKTLRIDRCEIGEEGARLFARKALFLGELRMLDAAHNHFGHAGLATLLGRAPAMLHTLRLRDNNLADQGVGVLADSPASNGLLEVDLSENNVGRAALASLASTKHLSSLLSLRVAKNDIDAAAAAGLKASPFGLRLTVLEFEKLLPVSRDGYVDSGYEYGFEYDEE